MRDVKEFYLTLPSDSCMEKYGSNNAAEWYTQLRSGVALKGQWEVCLSELQYMQSMFTLQTEQRCKVIMYVRWRTKELPENGMAYDTFEIIVPSGYYKSGDELLDCIRKQIPKYIKEKAFTIDFVSDTDRRVRIKFPNWRASVMFGQEGTQLAAMLGFPDGVHCFKPTGEVMGLTKFDL